MHRMKNQSCWPSQKRLSEVTGWSRDTVIRTIKSLSLKGHLKVKRKGRNNIYYILFF
jgi:DNA-binding GntR family transcriptional regulator